MKKFLAMMLMLLPMLAWGQTFSKETTLWTAIKDSHTYELVIAKNTNGKTTVTYVVANDEFFPYDDLVIVSTGSATKLKKFIEHILSLNEQMEAGMTYEDPKKNFYASKKADLDGNPRIYVSTDMKTFHCYRPEMLKRLLDVVDSFIADPKNPKTDKRYFN